MRGLPVGDLIIRSADLEDVPLLLEFVKGIAEYELQKAFFGERPYAEALIASLIAYQWVLWFFPQFFDIRVKTRIISGRHICASRAPWQRDWSCFVHEMRLHSQRTRLRADGM